MLQEKNCAIQRANLSVSETRTSKITSLNLFETLKMTYNIYFVCLLPATSKCTLWLAILPIELEAKHWYSPTSVLFFARLWITLVISSVPLDPIRLLESAMIVCPSFSHVMLEGGGEPSTRQFNVTGPFLRATVYVGSWLKLRGTKGPVRVPEIIFSTQLDCIQALAKMIYSTTTNYKL